MGSASPGVSAIAWRSPVTRDQLIDIVAFTLTGHVCGQCECSNRSGWNNPTVICACREAATAALTAIEAAGMLVVPRDDAVNVVASLAQGTVRNLRDRRFDLYKTVWTDGG